MTTKLKVAILGGGTMAQKHATAVRLLPGAQLVAVADPYLSAEEVAARFGSDVLAYRDVSELLEAARPDVVHIVTPPNTHYELAKQCLANGAHVYVEKPFALRGEEARELLDLAAREGLKACAAHQVLFQRAGQHYQTYLPLIGEIVHVESYFSFRPVRRRPDGGAALSPVDQLIDILPHPVYLLLSATGGRATAAPELAACEVDPAGEVRAILRAGTALATLVVTLRGRPIESYLRVVGTNGSVTADFILGDVVKSLGPGASAPAVVVKPFSQAMQKFWGSAAGLARLIFRRQKSYPGLGELLGLFYDSVRNNAAPPISADEILQTVRLCEQISQRLTVLDAEVETRAEADLRARAARLPAVDASRGVVFVTGGSGFLGAHVLRELRTHAWHVRALVRRMPPARRRVPGIEYIEGDLGRGVSAEWLDGVTVVVHLAAETAGNKAAHERNTVVATRHLLDAMRAAGVVRLINISSVAVLKPGPRVLFENSAVDRGNPSRGPYTWAKAEAEALAVEQAEQGLRVKTIRLGPLVDFDDYTPPGRLGRDIARLFVAVGFPSTLLSVCDVRTAAAVIRDYCDDFDAAPPVVNLLEVPAVTRGQLIERLRRSRPELRVVWLPLPVLRVLSSLATLVQLILRPRQAPLDIYSAFKSERYDPTIAAQVIRRVAGSRGQLP